VAVSRTGKRGKRAGGKKHSLWFSGKSRVRTNGFLKRLSGEHDGRPDRARTSKEEWVIRTVAQAVGAKASRNYVGTDDIASDLILELLNIGGFSWDNEEIVAWCRPRARWAVLTHIARRERPECDFEMEKLYDGEVSGSIEIMTCIAAPQDVCFDAHRAQALVRALPRKHRTALEILCDGGNPVEVAEEMGVTPWAAIALIREAREYIGRVDPLDEAA
jgi:hypothetical protein